MSRSKHTLDVSDSLWRTLELMSKEMNVDVDSLCNQALFTFARFNGYLTPGVVGEASAGAPEPVDPVRIDSAAAAAIARSLVDAVETSPQTESSSPPVPDEVSAPESPPPPEVVEGEVEEVPAGTFANDAVTHARGQKHGDDWDGDLQLLGIDGTVLETLRLGAPADVATLEPLVVDELRDANPWLRAHQQLVTAGRFGEALFALLRAVSNGVTVEMLRPYLAKHTLPLSPEASAARTKRAVEGLAALGQDGASPRRTVAFFVDELRQGADLATLLRELAIDQNQRSSHRIAIDAIRAAKAVSPEKKGSLAFTQCFIELSLGRPEVARVLIDTEVKPWDPKQGALLQTYVTALFSPFDFWPAKDTLAKQTFSVKPKPAVRTINALRVAVQKAGTRVQLLRDKLKVLAPKASWLPPDLAEPVLKKGPLELKGQDALTLEAWEDTDLPQLMRRLRSEWASLCWLIWLGGQDKLVLPPVQSTPRSATHLRIALSSREMALEAKLGGDAPEDLFEGEVLQQVQQVSQVPWLDVKIGDMQETTAELALEEVRLAIRPVLWADDLARPSPWTQEDDGEEHAIEDPTAAKPAESIVSEPGAGEGSESETAAIDLQKLKPTTGERQLWLQRPGHEPVQLVGTKKFIVGRERTCDVVLLSSRVSREHATIEVQGSSVLITDLGSSNGSFFGGKRFERREITDGDEVTFGNEKVTFRFSAP